MMSANDFHLIPENIHPREEEALRAFVATLDPGHLRDALYALLESFDLSGAAVLAVPDPWAELMEVNA